jgi:hypothetical protein
MHVLTVIIFDIYSSVKAPIPSNQKQDDRKSGNSENSEDMDFVSLGVYFVFSLIF